MNLSGKTLLVRADASNSIGAGHVMRCLALAQAWHKAGGRVIYACCSLPEVFTRRLTQEGMKVHFLDAATGSAEDVRLTRLQASQNHVSVLLIDLYQANATFLGSLRDSRWKTICLDDNAEADHYAVDIILNQNAHAIASLYTGKRGDATLLLGPDYALLRKEFSAYLKWNRVPAEVPQKILISMGGGDQISVLLPLLDKLSAAIRPMQVSLVLARRYPSTSQLEQRLGEAGLNFSLLIAPENMALELARHDLLLSSGGATVWEALYMQIPSLFLTIAPNQLASCRALKKRLRHPVWESLAEAGPEHITQLRENAGDRRILAESGRGLVDGRGIERIFQCLAI